jgi:hypothetical protein
MKYIRSTYEIMAFKVLNRDIDEEWVNWAYEMMTHGVETESLVLLAGTRRPFHQFPLQELTTNMFDELQLDLTSKEKVIKRYVFHLIEEVLSGEREMPAVLEILKDLYYELDYESFLSDFYSLYWAYEDLQYSHDQWYWPNADRSNINDIVTTAFKDWKEKHFLSIQ